MVRRSKKFLHGTIAVLIVTSLAATEEIADYRHESMEAVGAHFQSIRKIINKEVPFSSHLAMHADALADYGEIMDSLFTAGSEGGEALDKIWDEPEEFAEVVKDFKEATKELKDLVDQGAEDREIGAAVRNVGGSCKGCHDDYRQ